MDEHTLKNDQDPQQVEPNLSFVAQNETVSTTTNMSPPPSRAVPSSSRPSTLQLGGQRMASSILLTPNDYNKLLLSTPELDDKLRGYTIISNTTPTIQLQTPDIINAIAAQPANITFAVDGQPSPGVKVIEELLNAQQQQITTDNTGQQYIVVPPELHQLLQQLPNGSGNEQIVQLTQALRKAITATTPTSADVQNQTQIQETILNYLSTHIAPQQQGADLMARNRSMSSSMDTSINGNESSNSAISSTVASPLTSHIQHGTILLNKVKDEPQHVPSLRSGNANSSMERISLEHNEVLKKEKKRERNRQVCFDSFIDY